MKDEELQRIPGTPRLLIIALLVVATLAGAGGALVWRSGPSTVGGTPNPGSDQATQRQDRTPAVDRDRAAKPSTTPGPEVGRHPEKRSTDTPVRLGSSRKPTRTPLPVQASATAAAPLLVPPTGQYNRDVRCALSDDGMRALYRWSWSVSGVFFLHSEGAVGHMVAVDRPVGYSGASTHRAVDMSEVREFDPRFEGSLTEVVRLRIDYLAPGATPNAAEQFLQKTILVKIAYPKCAEVRPPPAGEKPTVVPALQSWWPSAARYGFNSESRIVVNEDPASGLMEVARTFARDLRALTGEQHLVTLGPARAGDVVLALRETATGEPTPAVQEEAYRLTIRKMATITAASPRGAFNGTRTLLQMLFQGRVIAGGTTFDWPAFPERSMLIDVGRKSFTLGWMRERVREMAYLKMNVLHLHLSDDLGFRVKSDVHPEIVSADAWSKEDLQSLIAYSREYQVEIIPEIDFPGHMRSILAAHPELQLADDEGNVQPWRIDISKAASYTLMQELITEFAPLFPGRYWHIGADEYLTSYEHYPQLESFARSRYGPGATGRDAYYGFINWADDLVSSLGKTMRMWNDGIRGDAGAVTLHSNIVIDYWYEHVDEEGHSLAAQELVNLGFRVANAAAFPFYYVVYPSGTGFFVNSTQAMYEQGDPALFADGGTLPPGTRTSNLGPMFSVWCDYPDAATEQEIASEIHLRVRIMAQLGWGSPKPAPLLGEFASYARLVGDAPSSADVRIG